MDCIRFDLTLYSSTTLVCMLGGPVVKKGICICSWASDGNDDDNDNGNSNGNGNDNDNSNDNNDNRFILCNCQDSSWWCMPSCNNKLHVWLKDWSQSLRRTTNNSVVVAVTSDPPWSFPIITWLNNFISNVFATNMSKIPTKSSEVTYIPPLWRHAFSITTGNVALHITSWRRE